MVESTFNPSTLQTEEGYCIIFQSVQSFYIVTTRPTRMNSVSNNNNKDSYSGEQSIFKLHSGKSCPQKFKGQMHAFIA